jgi:hypothetical protein
MLEFGEEGPAAARVASKIIGRYLHATPVGEVRGEG